MRLIIKSTRLFPDKQPALPIRTKLTVLLVGIIPVLSCAQTTPTMQQLRLIADGILREGNFQFYDPRTDQLYLTPKDAPAGTLLRIANAYNDWRYWNGVINLALLKLGESLHDSTYIRFVQRNLAFAFEHYAYFQEHYHGENKWDYPFGQFFILEELDDCGAMGASLIEIARHQPQQRYQDYLQKAADHILYRQSRLADGTLVRTFPQKYTLWADDLYMAVVFLCRMHLLPHLFDSQAGLNTAVLQVIKYHHYLFEQNKGLMYHNWYSPSRKPGVAFWGRANGWALLAQCELLDQLPPNHPQRKTLLRLFRRHCAGIRRYQDESGLWHQLLDRPDSYLETSCSAIFTYVFAHGVRRGYLAGDYLPVAYRGWQGLTTRIRPDGQIEGICTGTGVSDNLYDYYDRPTPLNDPHGIGFILLAGLEVQSMVP